jgi:hypothetical protein
MNAATKLLTATALAAVAACSSNTANNAAYENATEMNAPAETYTTNDMNAVDMNATGNLDMNATGNAEMNATTNNTM